MDFKKFKAATVQTSPVFLNVEKTVEKAITFIKEASQNGAQLIAFPEVFVAGYPYWNWIMTPVQGSKWYEKLYKCSVKTDDEAMQPLFQAVLSMWSILKHSELINLQLHSLIRYFLLCCLRPQGRSLL